MPMDVEPPSGRRFVEDLFIQLNGTLESTGRALNDRLDRTENLLNERLDKTDERLAERHADLNTKLDQALKKSEDQGLRLITVEVDLMEVKKELKDAKEWKERVDKGVWALICCTFLNVIAWVGGHLPPWGH